MSMAQSVTEALGGLVAATGFSDIPPSVVERAKVSLVHNFCVALAGRAREGVAHRIAARHHALPAEATLLATGVKVSAEGAAFANAALMHARSQDDTHAASTSHPGGPVVPAALAVAEELGATGPEFLAATVLGYEVLCRVGRDFDHLVTARGFRAAAVFGGFGAAAAAAKLIGLSGGEAASAIALASHTAGGLAQVWQEGSAEYPLQLGFCARNGIFAARAAAAGATAARELLEGRFGLYRAYAGAETAPVEALAGLGTDWQLSEVTVKAFPACAILQGPMELLLRLRSQAGLAPDEVAGIRLELNPYEADYPGVDNAGPVYASTTATKMSAQFCLAVGALDGRLSLADLARLDDPAICALAGRVEVARNPAVPERQSRLTVRRRGGGEVTGSIDAPVGRPDFDGIGRFALTMAPEMGLGADAAGELVEAIRSLDTSADLRRLLAAATAGT